MTLGMAYSGVFCATETSASSSLPCSAFFVSALFLGRLLLKNSKEGNSIPALYILDLLLATDISLFPENCCNISER